MEKQNRIRAYKGDPVNPGVSRKTAGINFAVEIPCGISASLVLYRKGAALPEVEIPFTEEHRTGRMCAILISGLKPDKYEYPECAPRKFKVWFTDLKGNVVIPDSFVLKLLLMYEG